MQRLIVAGAYCALFLTYMLLAQNLKDDSLVWLKQSTVVAMFLVGLVGALMIRLGRGQAVRDARRTAELESERARRMEAERSAAQSADVAARLDAERRLRESAQSGAQATGS